jgi:hypothetical protein
MNEPGAPPPRFLLVLMSPSVMAPGRPNCSWVHDAQVSVTVAPSSKILRAGDRDAECGDANKDQPQECPIHGLGIETQSGDSVVVQNAALKTWDQSGKST